MLSLTGISNVLTSREGVLTVARKGEWVLVGGGCSVWLVGLLLLLCLDFNLLHSLLGKLPQDMTDATRRGLRPLGAAILATAKDASEFASSFPPAGSPATFFS